jgi:glutathione S-transferase
MSLKLYYHPLASYCWKALIALHEIGIAFERQLVDLADPQQRAELTKLSPFTKFPALQDRGKNSVITEASVIIEYLARHYPGATQLVPLDADAAFEVRRRDRFFDLYVHEPMQKIVGDKIRPEGSRDPYGVEQARSVLATAYDVLERELGSQPWAAGTTFSMADCAAAPALYYANRVAPFGPAHPRVTAYLERLHERPSFARVFDDAQPYLAMFPG